MCEKLGKYLAEKNELQRTVAEEALKEAEEDFSKTVIWFAITMEESKSQAYYKSDRETGWLYVSYLSDCPEPKAATGIARGSEKIQQHCQLVHERLINKHSKTEAIKKIITCICSLRELEKDLVTAVDDTLLSNEYIVGRCEYCLQ